MKPRSPRLSAGRFQFGFTLVEAAIATLLVGGLLVVAMNLVGASRVTQGAYADREHALLLADTLLQEILDQPYEEPDGGGVAFGIEVGETLSLRASLDDADDYHGHSESPPTDADGQPIPGADRFTRTAAVRWVRLDEPNTVSATDTGLKRVVVGVDLGGKRVAELVGYRSADWPAIDAMEEGSP